MSRPTLSHQNLLRLLAGTGVMLSSDRQPGDRCTWVALLGIHLLLLLGFDIKVTTYGTN